MGVRVKQYKSNFKYYVSSSDIKKFNDEFWEEIYWCEAKTFGIIAPYIPGKFRLSESKLRKMHPGYFGWRGLIYKLFRDVFGFNTIQIQIEEHLIYGDCRAAVVVDVKPLLVAAYSGELDCVVMLRFPQVLVAEYSLVVGRKLVTTNSYSESDEFSGDWFPGPKKEPNSWTAFHPVIADFLTDDQKQLAYNRSQINADEWKRTFKMGLEYKKKFPGIARGGRPENSILPAMFKNDPTLKNDQR